MIHSHSPEEKLTRRKRILSLEQHLISVQKRKRLNRYKIYSKKLLGNGTPYILDTEQGTLWEERKICVWII